MKTPSKKIKDASVAPEALAKLLAPKVVEGLLRNLFSHKEINPSTRVISPTESALRFKCYVCSEKDLAGIRARKMTHLNLHFEMARAFSADARTSAS